MSNDDNKKKFIRDYFKIAKRRLRYVLDAFDEEDYNYVVRECQTVVEICSKALILRWGFVVPEKHNLANELEDDKDLFSKEFQNNISFVKRLSKRLREQREKALYGDVNLKKSPYELYTKESTEKYLKDTQKFYELCKNELKDFLEGKG